MIKEWILGVPRLDNSSISRRYNDLDFNFKLNLLIRLFGGSFHVGNLGSDTLNSPNYMIYLTDAEQKEVDKVFDPKLDNCHMDTIFRCKKLKYKFK